MIGGLRAGSMAAILLELSLCGLAGAGEAVSRAALPPELPWEGKSRVLLAGQDDPWLTPAERSGFAATPSYAETISWLKRLEAASPELRLLSLGRSPEGRDIWMVVASRERAFTPMALRATGKPVLLAQAGIHAGEIDGKDAGLMLLRDMTARGTKRQLLDEASLLFVPILSVDGHERTSPFTRINQRGPVRAGWRTTARNLNLNRDYAKLDAPETRAIVHALDEWDPDLYVDIHVTDGMDYQYDITFGYNGPHAWSPAIARWLEGRLEPALHRDLAAMGHVPSRFFWPLDELDPAKGFMDPTTVPRLSTGYGDARHLPTVLVETHSLKPYEQRVLGTYVFLETALRLLGSDGLALKGAVAADRNRRPQAVPLDFKPGEDPPQTIDFAAVGWRVEPSEVSGGKRIAWTGKPAPLKVRLQKMNAPRVSAARPKAYWIPPAWGDVIDRLALHGIEMERVENEREIEVEMDRLMDVKLAAEPFEGRVAMTARAVPERRRERFPAGSVRVPTDQPLGDLAILLLEPASPDSFLQWGFFLEVLQRTEYVEGYIMEPMAERMLAEDPGLAERFKKRLAEDAAFARHPAARLQWFYEQTPFFDERWRLYPVGRER